MRYVVAETFDKKELHSIFDADITPRIGIVIRTHNGRSYKILDIEYCPSTIRGSFVQGLLRRMPDPHHANRPALSTKR